MSSAPADPSGIAGGTRLGPLGRLRWLWHPLTSMRTALLLLLLLSLASIPGSLIPQEVRPPAAAAAAVGDGWGDGRTATLWRRLPSAATLDKLSYRLNALAFPLWTFAVIAGAVWAEAAWGRYWGWDPKETWAFITWVAYAAYLHARATAGWKGRRAAVLGLIAFAAFVFDYYGVNIFITGLHSYGGLPTK